MNDKSTKSVSSAVSRSIAGEWETPGVVQRTGQ